MNNAVREKVSVFLILLTLAVAILFARSIGDEVTSYRAYRTLGVISKLTYPLRDLIDQIQVERTLGSRYLSTQDPQDLSLLEAQYHIVDEHFKKFKRAHTTTSTTMLAIPDPNLKDKVTTIAEERERTKQPGASHFKFLTYYKRLNEELIDYQAKMFIFSDGADYQNQIKTLLAAQVVQEAIAQEQAFVGHNLAVTDIKRGEIPLIQQEIQNQDVLVLRLKNSDEAQVRNFFNSPEYLSLLELRRQFEGRPPDLNGSKTRSEEYVQAAGAVISRLEQLALGVQVKLEKLASVEQDNLRNEIVWTTTLFILVMLLSVGGYVVIRGPLT